MNIFAKSLAVLSAVFLLSACDSSPFGGADGKGGAGGPAKPGTQEDLAQNVGDRVFFAYNSSVITSEGQETLKRQAAWLKQYPNLSVTVEGHCDERGTSEYNTALGASRAAAAKKYLTGLGVSSSRLTTISYGKERPAVIGSDESAWSQNRRAVSVISQ